MKTVIKAHQKIRSIKSNLVVEGITGDPNIYLPPYEDNEGESLW